MMAQNEQTTEEHPTLEQQSPGKARSPSVVRRVDGMTSVDVAVAVRRLQRRRVSARGMTNGTQELESRIRPVVKLGQTGLDSFMMLALTFGRRSGNLLKE